MGSAWPSTRTPSTTGTGSSGGRAAWRWRRTESLTAEAPPPRGRAEPAASQSGQPPLYSSLAAACLSLLLFSPACHTLTQNISLFSVSHHQHSVHCTVLCCTVLYTPYNVNTFQLLISSPFSRTWWNQVTTTQSSSTQPSTTSTTTSLKPSTTSTASSSHKKHFKPHHHTTVSWWKRLQQKTLKRQEKKSSSTTTSKPDPVPSTTPAPSTTTTKQTTSTTKSTTTAPTTPKTSTSSSTQRSYKIRTKSRQKSGDKSDDLDPINNTLGQYKLRASSCFSFYPRWIFNVLVRF